MDRNAQRSPHLRRQVPDEIAYLLTEGPLVVSANARLLAWHLWRKSTSGSARWPTHDQLAQHFEKAHRHTIGGWVKELEAAGMVTEHELV